MLLLHLSIGVTETSSNLNTNWNQGISPKKEYVHAYHSPDLSHLSDIIYQICTPVFPFNERYSDLPYYPLNLIPDLKFGIKLEAEVRLQVFHDYTFRAKMDNIQFFTDSQIKKFNNSQNTIELQTAFTILNSEQNKSGTPNQESDDYGKFMEQSFMILEKGGNFNSNYGFDR